MLRSDLRDTVGCEILIDGELALQLDDGKQTTLKQFDVVIQNGTRYAWRNLT